MKRLLLAGTYAAAIVIILIGFGAIAAGTVGQQEVRHQLSQEKITGSSDMKPSEHPGKGVTCTVADKSINTGVRARCFAQYMRLHALESTKDKVYAEMPQYLDANGQPTNQKSAAATDPKTGQPAANTARNIWVTETALTTALNTSFLAESVARFAIVVGLALTLTGLLLLAIIHRPARSTGPRRASGAARSGPRSAKRTPSRRRPARG